ncbi:hypothetical protein PR048_023186 [Dryococelus australis]|uniref:Tesmin/TSO1-like CXC domain-containing protein n=1 Tax=Dryococelus australis TaxID=614101 RepID=A0ABQ9GTC8_9NEOP|nr:hypothetical protein PR048_023186 [Dryococelus australis]
MEDPLLVEKVAAAKSLVAPASWPLTESAAKYHSFRTYYQISVWKSKETLLTPTEWGWFVKENSYYPTVTDMPPALEWLLKMIHCSCKTQCATMRCGCKQNGLPCSASCGVCQFSGCDNIIVIDNNDCDSDA